MMPFIRNNR